MKTVYFNLSVGSAVEYAGNIFKSWIEDFDMELIEIKDQSQQMFFSIMLADASPDLIIINDAFQSCCQATLTYRADHPNVKIILIGHCWADLQEATGKPNWLTGIIDASLAIFSLSGMDRGTKVSWSSKLEERYYPTPPEFKSTKKWRERPGVFCYIGNILPHKFGREFLDKIKGTDLYIECYGHRWDKGSNLLSPWGFPDVVMEDYYAEFDAASKNLKYMEVIPQNQVAEVLNRYRYFVLPHDGYEAFNWTLKQAIYCGTIPLVINNRIQTQFDFTWLDWAHGYYYGCNNPTDMINNLQLIVKDNIDRTDLSELISTEFPKVTTYNGFRLRFRKVVADALLGKFEPYEEGYKMPTIQGVAK